MVVTFTPSTSASYVKAQLAAGHKIVSFMLKNLSSSNAVVSFNSREAASHAPFLQFGF